MKKLFQLAIALTCLSGLVLAQDVAYNFDEKADFSKYKTYKWEKHPKSLDVDQLTMGQLAKGFEAALAAKGLTKTESNPDLVIVFQLAVSQEKEMTAYNTGGFGYGPGWRGGWYGGGGMSTSTATTSTINIGTVVLDMYDTKTKTLVWRGQASKTVDGKSKPEKRQKTIDKAAQKMLKNYPPKKK
ncbi:MAG: DUF4136 domain-containing protein [Acidobacteria bacterium]|nr:DUF4136 domain-containing protein [Acidobacteriota bacterium]